MVPASGGPCGAQAEGPVGRGSMTSIPSRDRSERAIKRMPHRIGELLNPKTDRLEHRKWQTSFGAIAVALILLTGPGASEAQQPATAARIGYLSPMSPTPAGLRFLDALRQGLHEHGYVEGQNLTIEVRWAQGRFDRLPDLAVDLVGLKVDIIVAMVTQASLAA